MTIIVKSMIYSVIVVNALQSTQVARMAVMLTLACSGVVITTIAITMQPAAASTLRAVPVTASLSVSSFM